MERRFRQSRSRAPSRSLRHRRQQRTCTKTTVAGPSSSQGRSTHTKRVAPTTGHIISAFRPLHSPDLKRWLAARRRRSVVQPVCQSAISRASGSSRPRAPLAPSSADAADELLYSLTIWEALHACSSSRDARTSCSVASVNCNPRPSRLRTVHRRRNLPFVTPPKSTFSHFA